ncbi:imidazoleglycerol-phosphate dehydratase HisB [Gammaproteobacteria bacterium]|jgi:imidazoleglycerol-phosphate dehydratase|nr:imidazoleglycerol-phosphate dehydratase HisB [Gammaproteobacteria bacterium]MDB4089750.1 imidazoleglycerol-phosphate dehydratase HisB [Gammaproteobacteria bacterium]MDC0089294.1 imidazoleglycerol-phosphate dehydratase HisB [Gammaproteobacteria bacterium]
MKKRIAQVERVTKETQIKAEINLDGQGDSSIKADLPFLEHMLEQVARHGMFDLTILAKGDLEIDAHHTVEDVGIVLGQALEKALGNKIGITRFGSAYVPLDESLSRVVLDFSGRPGLEFNVTFPRSRVGEFDIDLLQEFFQGFVNHAKATIHIDNIRGGNSHHIAETIFKAFGKALKMAVTIDPRQADKIPSTKELI